MFKLDQALRPLGPDDYEEATLIRSIYDLQETGRLRLSKMLPKERQKAMLDGLNRDEASKLTTLVGQLGYHPNDGRKSRPRGRPRDAALPDPLPAVGTELLSCLGEVYVVKGYAYTAVHGRLAAYNTCLYEHDGETIARSIANLFAGTLADRPIVTFDGDSRGLKPAAEVPLAQRRSMTKQDLKEDRLLRDADAVQYEQGRHRRY